MDPAVILVDKSLCVQSVVLVLTALNMCAVDIVCILLEIGSCIVCIGHVRSFVTLCTVSLPLTM
jgi:hypothetical protein